MPNLELTAEEAGPLLIEFDDAELVPMPPGASGAVLRVRGQAPCLNMVVRLVPVRYIQQPDYWAIQVLGDLRGGFCLEALRDFDEALVPTPLGKSGVVVVGATKRQRLENL